MGSQQSQKLKLALVYASLPAVEEIDQFRLIQDVYDITVVTSESICSFLAQNSVFKNLTCVAIPDYDDNMSFLPGLEQVLSGFDLVIVKEKVGLYAYQAVKAKWKNRFRLLVWVDNLTLFPGEDVDRMRTVREEVTNAADAFIVQSDAATQTLLLEGIEKERILKFSPWIESIRSGTISNKVKGLEALGLSDGDFVIAHMGNLEWEDGLYDLAHGVKLAMDSDASLKRRLKIVFCSIGSFAGEFRDRLVKLGIDKSAVYVAPSRDATVTVLNAADCIYYNSTESRDRVDGDPYRLVTAMVNELPVLGARSPLIEEYLGKHRIDFCKSSPVSVFKAIKKIVTAKSLVNNVVAKNFSVANKRYNKDAVTKQMLTVFNKVQKKIPKVELTSIDRQVMEAESKVESKQYLEAIDLIDTIFKVEGVPLHHLANLYRLIGHSFLNLGDADAGRTAYLTAVELDPYSVKSFVGLGTAAMTKNNYQSAIIHFQKAISLSPKDEMANLGLGLAFQGLGEFKEAMRWVANALEVNFENTAAIYSIVKLAQETDIYVQAEDALLKYIAAHPHDHNMIYSLAGVYYKLGRFDDVISQLNSIVSVDPTNARAQMLINQAKSAMSGLDKTGSTN